MRKKLNDENGLTLVEMLAATVILVLLGLMLNTGLQMAVDSYRAITAQSEVELLLSTAVDALTNDLRYARDVQADGTYTSDSYGEHARFELKGGRIMSNGFHVLPTGAYGLDGAYQVKKIDEATELVTYAEDDGTFTITLRVETADGKISVQTPDGGVTVRCLNPKKEETGGVT